MMCHTCRYHFFVNIGGEGSGEIDLEELDGIDSFIVLF